MIIENTTRNIQKAYDLKKNFSYSIQVSELEPLIDGAIIDNMSTLDINEATQLFQTFVIGKTGFTIEEYNKNFEPLKRVSGFDFMMNPYLNNISLNDIVTDGISLVKDFYKPNEFVILNEPKQDENLMKKYSIGIFDSLAYTYVLKNNSFVWMSVNPMEIKTAEKAIQRAHGNVLVLGGGLGYYPYMVSLKNEVKSITIVEGNKQIKDILEFSILPQFKNNKVKIIHDDAYQFMNTNIGQKYDSIFIDVWPDNVKGTEEYKKFVKYEGKYPEAAFDYWLEDSILDSIIVNIFQYFSAKLGTTEYQNYFSLIAPDLWTYLESLHDTISRPEQMSYYLSKKFAKEVAINM